MEKRCNVHCPHQIQLLLDEQKGLLNLVVNSIPTVSPGEKGLRNRGTQPERHRHKCHRLKRIPPSLRTSWHHHKPHHCPYTRYKRPTGKKEGGRRGGEKREQSFGRAWPWGFSLEIQSIVNISPCRITLKPLTAASAQLNQQSARGCRRGFSYQKQDQAQWVSGNPLA